MKLRITFSAHIVDFSPYPFIASISLLSFVLSIVFSFHFSIHWLCPIYLNISLISLLASSYFWWQEVIIEGTYQGHHTLSVQRNLNYGFILFVISEVMVFFSLFFGYFYNSLVPNVQIGSLWPPLGIETFDYKTIPLLNTALLFFSGFSITASQHFLYSKHFKFSSLYLFLTIILASIFLGLQVYEYSNALFTITDSFFGSSFFALTGLHGSHVAVGIIFLFVTFLRLINSHFTNLHHIGAHTAAIYYHFVDAVWLFLYAVVYCWGH